MDSFAERQKRMKNTKFPWQNEYSKVLVQALKQKEAAKKKKLPRAVRSCASTIGQKFKLVFSENPADFKVGKHLELLGGSSTASAPGLILARSAGLLDISKPSLADLIPPTEWSNPSLTTGPILQRLQSMSLVQGNNSKKLITLKPVQEHHREPNCCSSVEDMIID